MALFVMKWEGIPTFTPVNKTHSLKGAGFFLLYCPMWFKLSMDDNLVFDHLNER